MVGVVIRAVLVALSRSRYLEVRCRKETSIQIVCVLGNERPIDLVIQVYVGSSSVCRPCKSRKRKWRLRLCRQADILRRVRGQISPIDPKAE